jgi:hypothetical protein
MLFIDGLSLRDSPRSGADVLFDHRDGKLLRLASVNSPKNYPPARGGALRNFTHNMQDKKTKGAGIFPAPIVIRF